MKKWTRAFYQPSIPLGENGMRVTASKKHIELSKNAAKEGMVLLKNEENTLPLKKSAKVALFGKASFDYVKGGGGSGDVTVSYVRNLYEGFKELTNGISICEELADFYRGNVKEQYANKVEPGMTTEPEIPEKLLGIAKEYTDTAIITICRFSGEGWDRKEDFYLTEGEKQMVEMVKENFRHIIVVLNIGGIISTDWFKDDDRIQAVLLAWQGGMEGGLAAAELLAGEGNPSGKLADTFAADFSDYPSSENFHESDDYVKYLEDIYVGYRYFETIPGAAHKVNYPFGFGLSYTTFDIRPVSCTVDCTENIRRQNINIQTKVTNTGAVPGKEVVQVYYSAPQGKLGKPAKVLAGFAKTKELAPGETEKVAISFPISAMASYDDTGKVKESAYVLEKGEYRFFVGNSINNVAELEYTYHCEEDTVAEQLSKRLAPKLLEKRMLADGSFEELATVNNIESQESATSEFAETNNSESELSEGENSPLQPLKWEEMECIIPAVRSYGRFCFLLPENKRKMDFIDVAEGRMTLDEFVKALPDEDLMELLGGQPNTGVANTFGFGNLSQYGVPNIMTADGPAGLRIAPECSVNTTAWPCATLIACTWNQELAEEIGAAGAMEVKENNIAVWLTPAVNIHRNPLCGRNFEYYSEDPLLTGKMAAAMVRGIQSQNIAATAKHFALNNKETNRKNSDSRASERAIREIYLKGFEIIVKEAGPWAIMSSYNIINGARASENRELLTDILRDEWGYEGMVTTDWWAFSEHYKEVKAGNDLKMGCGYPERLRTAMEQGLITREDMELCGKRILELILKIE